MKTMTRLSTFGFHLSLAARQRYDIDGLPARPVEGHTLADFRKFAAHLNRQRSGTEAKAIEAGQLMCADIVAEAQRKLIQLYAEEHSAQLEQAIEQLDTQELDEELSAFEDTFSEIPSSQTIAIGELALLRLLNANPALSFIRELFDETVLQQKTSHPAIVKALETLLADAPTLSPIGAPLFECLWAPIKAAPESLAEQVDYIRNHWATFLPENLSTRMVLARDVVREERRPRFAGPGPAHVLEFDFAAEEYPETEAFSRDANWMPNVVLMAKSTYVWLDQLSKKYDRPITTLDQIPDEELDLLARWGFSGLWLIGLWQRSAASKLIKQMMGNPEAESSAYSLHDYVILPDLGGEAALDDLRHRAWERGLRLAGDMVPNHMGIDARWVVEHPD
ncbi:MAG: alpha-amylase, partial [Proteobacteria bacterium]|nr:alpha-amylase [Pseudomonadota bacterium]